MSAYTYLLLETLPDDKVGIITLNRYERRNAMDVEVREEMMRALAEMEADPATRVIIITGGPKVFSAGADLQVFHNQSPHEVFNRISLWDISFAIAAMRKPVIAAVAGAALGGGFELALACDVRIGAENAKVGQTEVNVGLVPGGGGTLRLTQLAGIGKAKELILTGRVIRADEAERYNIFNKVVPDDKLMEEALDMARQMSRHSLVSLQYAKFALNNATHTDARTACAIENSLFSMIFASEDKKEGFNAFFEKRPPNYTGK